MLEIKIREAVLSDSKQLAIISQNDLGYECTEDYVKTNFSLLDFKRECVFVAEYESKVIGYVHVEKYQTLYMEPLANVLGLAVSADYHRQGVGRSLMAAAEEWAKKIGASGVRLNSGGTRINAHKFYRSIGYDQEKQQVRFLKMF